jgi:hypothetical protein
MTKIAGSGSISQRHGSVDTDPNPHQNLMDPEHWIKILYLETFLFFWRGRSFLWVYRRKESEGKYGHIFLNF